MPSAHPSDLTQYRRSGRARDPTQYRRGAHPPDLAPYLERLADLHPRLCPRQVLGVRMGLWSGELLDLELPRRDKRLLVLVETDGCFSDGLSVVTGCWLGRRTLRLVDYGRVAATVIDTLSGRAVRLRPHPRAREAAVMWAPEARDRWHAQLRGYQVMPADEVLQFEWVTLVQPVQRILGRPGVRVACASCGEEILNQRELAGAMGPLCVACSSGAYYSQALIWKEPEHVRAPHGGS